MARTNVLPADAPARVTKDRQINELIYSCSFLSAHPMKCIHGRFFTVDGLVPDEGSLKQIIFDDISEWKESGVAIWRPFTLEKGGFVPGENRVELTLTNSLRNLLGPHHVEEGESYGVAPNQFFQESKIWGTPSRWNDGYCLVETSLKEE